MNKNVYNIAYILYYTKYENHYNMITRSYEDFKNTKEFNKYYNLAKNKLRKEKLKNII